ncbi:MAG: dephospho-CoA kinase, partial [Candidatus Omnitrophica bacterium]|nr:dephospho-CoA kinase [Candidatus Omnitrophota bacterium]
FFSPIRRMIVRAFGEDILTDKKIDRKKLAACVFGEPQALKTLEGILHPMVKALTKARLKKIKAGMIVIDAPLLLEAGWENMVDVVVVVRAGQASQVKRIRRRMGLKKEDILKRIRRQMPLKDKLKYADFVIDNRGCRADTYRQVKNIFGQIQQ